MSEETNSIFKGKSGRVIGTIIGFIVGLLIIIPKILFLIICVVIGYFVGKYFDEKGKGEVSLDEVEKHK